MLAAKDYTAIAKAIKDNTRSETLTEEDERGMMNGRLVVDVDRLTWALADYFGQNNPRFSRHRFFDACLSSSYSSYPPPSEPVCNCWYCEGERKNHPGRFAREG